MRVIRYILQAVLSFSFLLIVSCSEVQESISVISGEVNSGEIFERDGQKFVTLTLNSMNPELQDARTILPDCPDLYFSVTASTVSEGGGTDEASCSYTSSVLPDVFIPQPFYAQQKNRMSGLSLTLKVGKAYRFTVYGTEKSPAELCLNSTFFGKDYTGFTASSNFGSLTAEQRNWLSSLAPGIYTNSSTYNSELVYYGFREKIVSLIKGDAIVKGTVQYYIGEDDDGNVLIYKGADSSGMRCSVISVPVDSTGTEGTGYAFIPVDLAATYSADSSDASGAYAVTQLGLNVRKIRFYWTGRMDHSDDGYMEILVIHDGSTYINSRSNEKFAIKPYMKIGTYDTDLVFYSLDSTGNYTDVFTVHDTLKVLCGQESVLLGSGSFYKSGIDFECVYAGSPDDTGANAYKILQNTWNYTNCPTSAQKGYRVTAANISNYFRTVFYVSGSGGKLVSCASGKETGSLLYPFKSVSDAVNAVMKGDKGV